jgi:CDP-glucose 4,6-dehydratase
VRVEPAFWRGRRVFLTGHTGFKGSWLALWLERLGAEVVGYSNGVPTTPSLFELAAVGRGIASLEGDVRDRAALATALARHRPEIVIHLAAQALVRASYDDPVETYETNVLGTVNLLEAARPVESVRVLLNVTTDKVYVNRDREQGYREDEALGGDDPYSSSKACSELVTAAYRRSFFDAAAAAAVATARAGNVIGGGDFARDRLIPDLMRAASERGEVEIRSPSSTRPWQHVLNALEGYLVLAQRLWDDRGAAGGWNFGPAAADSRPVGWIVEHVSELWPGRFEVRGSPGPHPHEARTLHLDSTRARELLGWSPRWDLGRGLAAIVEWHRAHEAGEDVREIVLRQIDAFSAGHG